MQRLFYQLLLIATCSFGLTACSEEEMPNPDYYNWALRNDEYFRGVLEEAKEAIKTARATYGNEWEAHCDWRVFRTYLKTEHSNLTHTDTICVKVIERGTGPGCPLYTDSVKINYIGRTMPTVSYPEGRVFDHSGVYNSTDEVFNPTFATPTTLHVANTVEGFTTALQNMHVGDRWMLYIPAPMGYASSTLSNSLPAFSTLIFDLQLVAYCRTGTGFYE